MHMIVLNIISYQYIVQTRKSKNKVVSLILLSYRQEVRIMERLGALLVLLTYTLGSRQGSDGKELPVPISDVLERLVDLEKRLLIQEEKNEDLEKRLLIQEEKNADLEKRLLEQEILNAAQGEVIQNMAVCDCLSNEKATTYLSDGRYYLL